MSLAPGTRLGPYEIVAPLGAGGMCEVWRARDPRLSRDVAIKALPAAFAQDPERLARFEREAKLLASLSHPNIAGIFGLEDVEGTRYLVLEFVDGESLEARLRRGALPVDEALDVARQVAAGVEAAHEAGVVHRDLKPGNIMLTPAGHVKVLDFGLAKGGVSGAASGSDPSLSASPTMTAVAGTQAGVILGTAAYMSPEQARGKAVDRRTDIWSFGCVVYEMLTAQRVYDGETVSDMVARILEREPEWSALPANTPPRLRSLLKRCLTKDARLRLRDIGEARLELEAIAAGDHGVAPVTAAARRVAPAWALPVVALVAALALGYAFAPWRAHPTDGRLVRFSIPAPAGTTFNNPAEAEVSPDGSAIVFDASDSLGVSRLYMRSLANPESRVVPGTEKAGLPFWSPDGRSLGFFADGKLRRVALDGGAPADLCDAPDARGGTWSRSGVIVFAPNNQGGLERVPENGGAPATLTTPDPARHERGHRYPQFLPDGRHFLFVAIGTDAAYTTYVGSIDGGKPSEVCTGGSMARDTDTGQLLVLDSGVAVSQRRLLTRAFDARRGRASGDARLVLDHVYADNFGYLNASTGPGQTLVVQHWSDPHARFSWFDRRGAPLGTAIEDLVGSPTISPDGQRVAYAGADPMDLYVRDLATGVSTRLTFENRLTSNPTWSPDSKRIAFARVSPSQGWEMRAKNADGSGPDSLVFHGPGLFSFPAAWSHDGKWILARCTDAAGNYDLWKIPMDGAGKPEPYQHTPEQEGGGSFSPDDHWIAYTTSEAGKTSLFVQSFPTPGSKYQVSVDDLAGGGWDTHDGMLIAVSTQGDLFEVDVSTAGGFHQGAAHKLFRVFPAQFVADEDRATGRFLIGTAKDVGSASRLEVILGWPHLLDKK